jgi:hypothetical protein
MDGKSLPTFLPNTGCLGINVDACPMLHASSIFLQCSSLPSVNSAGHWNKESANFNNIMVITKVAVIYFS